MKFRIKEYIVSLIDIKSIKDEAAAEFRKEAGDKAKAALKAQMRAVEQARKVLRAEELKLSDLESQIEDGTL